RGCEDKESCTAADGEARPCPAPTARHTSDPARSAEFSVHWPASAPRLAGARRPWSSVKSSTAWTLFTPALQLNGTLAEAGSSFEMFEGAHWSIYSRASASLKAPSMSDGARSCSRFASRYLHRHSRPQVPCSPYIAFSSSIVLGTRSWAHLVLS